MHVAGSGPFAGGLAIVREVMREDGIRGFYRGCGTNLLRTTPAAVIIFLAYEGIVRQVRKGGRACGGGAWAIVDLPCQSPI